MSPRVALALGLFYISFGQPANSIAADVAPRAAYEGQRIVNIRFDPPAQPVTSEDLNGLLKWKAGDVLNLTDVRAAIKRLYATGSYSSIDVETEPAAGGVELVIRTTEQWFIGPVEARGKVNLPPSEGQLADAARLELGQPFGDDDLDRALKGMRGLLERNGLYNAEVTPKIERDPVHQEVSITFQVNAGQARPSDLAEVTGDTRLPVDQVAGAAKYKGLVPLEARDRRQRAEWRAQYFESIRQEKPADGFGDAGKARISSLRRIACAPPLKPTAAR